MCHKGGFGLAPAAAAVAHCGVGPPGEGRCAGLERGTDVAENDENVGTDVASRPPRRVWSSRRKRIEGKTQYVRVSMSEMERAKLLKLEAQTGLSPSAILVDAALGTGDPASLQLRKQELATLLEIRYLIATAANNINQVARHQNTTGEMASNGRAAVQEARQVMAKIVDVIEELKP